VTQFPWRRYREIGMGVLGWPPECFWRATPHDLLTALAGWREARGLRQADAGLSNEDVAALRAKLDAAPRGVT
jgi:uncharacterized phage protein (TIGR02216 family)